MRRALSSNRHSFPPRGLARLGLAAVVGIGVSLAIAAPSFATNNDPVRPGQNALHGTCVKAAKATYTHTFTLDQSKHEATATISLNGRLCRGQEQAFTLVSYLAPAASFQVPQYVFDSHTETLTHWVNGLTFRVDVPECYTQVDFVFGSRVIDPITSTSDVYGNDKVGSDQGAGSRSKPASGSGAPQHAWFNGGTSECQTTPKVEATSDCSGSVTLNLRNGKDAASTTYVITGDGGYRTEVVVSRAAAITPIIINAPNSKHLKITSGGVVVKEYSWTRPADCVAPTISTTSDCSSSSVTISNPASNTTTEATIAIAGSGSTRTVTVAAGATQTVSLAAGVTVGVTVFGETVILDLTKPGTCDSAATLPVTGANTVMIASIALLLVVLGTTLYSIARRRKITFEA